MHKHTSSSPHTAYTDVCRDSPTAPTAAVDLPILGAGSTPEGDTIPAMADPSCGTEENPFQAVMVFSDPVDWYRDLQLITDVVMSGQYEATFVMTAPTCRISYQYI